MKNLRAILQQDSKNDFTQSPDNQNFLALREL